MNRSLLVLILFCQLTWMTAQRWSETEIADADIFIRANQKKILGEYEDAIELYAKLLAKQPTNATAHHDLARIYLAQKDLEKAEASAAKSVRYDPNNIWYQITLGEIQEVNLNYDAATKTFESLAIAKNDKDLYEHWAQILIKNKKPETAIAVYDQMDQKFGRDEYRSDQKADLYLESGNRKAAINEIKGWSDRHPDNDTYRIKLAKFYIFLDEKNKAKKVLEDVIKKDLNNADAILAMRSLESNPGNEDGIISILNNEALNIDQRIKTAMMVLNDGSLGEVQSLIPALEKLAEQNNTHAPSQAAYADALFLIGDVAGAEKYYKRTLDIDPSNYMVWDQLMSILAGKKAFNALTRTAENASDYFPNQSGPYFFQAQAAMATDDLSEAESLLDEALFINPGSTRARILKASLIEKKEGINAAIEWLIDLENKNTDVIEYLGDLHLKSGNKSDAQKSYEDALSKGGNTQRLRQKIQSI